MNTKIKKMFFAWQSEEEEQWLNEMAAKGLELARVGFGTYIFEEGVPGRYQYRLEMLDNLPEHEESVKYIGFLNEMGIESIATFNRWVYFRKRTEEGPFDLFSDVESKIRHLRRVLMLLIGVSPAWVITGFTNLIFAITGKNPFNIVLCVLLFILGALITIGSVKIYRKLQHLKKERVIHE